MTALQHLSACRTPWVVALAAAFCLAYTGKVSGGDEIGRATLKGAGEFWVLTEEMKPEVEKAGLTRQALQTAVELHLRKAGLKVLTAEQAKENQVRAVPFLYVNVQVRLGDDMFPGLNAVAIRLEFEQLVFLSRDRNIVTSATPWHTGSLTLAGTTRLPDVRGSVIDLVDEFLNDWLTVNPPANAAATMPSK